MDLNRIKKIIEEVSAENGWKHKIHNVELYKVPEPFNIGTEYMEICFEVDEVFFYSDLDDLRDNWSEEEFKTYILEGVHERIEYGEGETFEGNEDVYH